MTDDELLTKFATAANQNDIYTVAELLPELRRRLAVAREMAAELRAYRFAAGQLSSEDEVLPEALL